MTFNYLTNVPQFVSYKKISYFNIKKRGDDFC